MNHHVNFAKLATTVAVAIATGILNRRLALVKTMTHITVATIFPVLLVVEAFD
jgi:hypothetical protein